MTAMVRAYSASRRLGHLLDILGELDESLVLDAGATRGNEMTLRVW
jgi:hypothetical protein